MVSSSSASKIDAVPSPYRPAWTSRRPALRLLPAPRTTLGRGPFIVLVLGLLILGTIGLLVLNTVIAADSFRAEQLVQRNAELTVVEQELRRQVAEGLSPEALAEAARELGMVAAGQPGFVVVNPDGSIVIQGTPVPAGIR
ncbi:MAG: hypothetical protein ACR2I7_07155 [Geodermatophilaceae bacterium]